MATAQALNSAGRDTRAALRAHTRVAHERLHRLPEFVALAAGTLDLCGYVHLLQGLYRYHLALDACLRPVSDPHARACPVYRWHSRAPLLAADLAGAGAALQAVADLDLPCVTDLASYAGVVYVVEGSLMGAAALERAARAVTGANAETTTRYWAWSRQVATQRVAAMTALLEVADRDAQHRQHLLDAADHAFRAFADCFAVRASASGAPA